MAREVRVAILGDSKDFSRAVNSASADAKRLNGSFRKVGSFAKTAAIGIAGLAVGAAALGKSFIDAAEESQKVTRQTAAVIKSMGNAANTSAEEVAKLASKLSLKTGIDDELIQSGQNVLLTFGKIRNEVGKGNDVFDRATKAALNMSVALDQDMQSAVTQIGKALNDPIQGLTALGKAGIQFTDQQKEQIKALVETGDSLGAQKIILKELEKQFGGSAEAQATASDKLKVAWGNIQEQLGTKLLPIFEKVATWLANTLPAAIAKAEEWGNRFTAWARDHEPFVRAMGVAVGVVLAGAMAAYAASATAAAIATIAATWPLIAIGAAAVALGAGLVYAYNNWGWFRLGVEAAKQVISQTITYVRRLIDGIQDLSRAVGRALGPLSRLMEMAPGGGGGGLLGSVLKGAIPGLNLTSRAQGGVVPGAIGQPMPILAHGGEVVLTRGQQMRSGGGGGNVYHFHNHGIIASQPEADRWIQDSIARARRNGIACH